MAGVVATSAAFHLVEYIRILQACVVSKFVGIIRATAVASVLCVKFVETVVLSHKLLLISMIALAILISNIPAIAAYSGQVAVLRTLAALGFDLSASDLFGRTPATRAAYHSSLRLSFTHQGKDLNVTPLL